MNDIQQGYTVCECKKFAYLSTSEVLRKLPKDYAGELCQQCRLWVCAIEKIRKPQSGEAQETQVSK